MKANITPSPLFKYLLVDINKHDRIELITDLKIGQYILFENKYYEVKEQHKGYKVAFTKQF